MTTTTASGKVFVHTTIDKEAKEELKRRGIPIGSASALWLKHVDEKREYNQQINKMTENIAKMQELMKKQALRIVELEGELHDRKAKV